jgi:hypothetical protein
LNCFTAFSLKRKLQSHAKGGFAYMDLPAVAEELSLHRCLDVKYPAA